MGPRNQARRVPTLPTLVPRRSIVDEAGRSFAAFGRELSSTARAKYNDYLRNKPASAPASTNTRYVRRPTPTKGNISYQEATRPVIRAGHGRYRTRPSRWQLFKDSVKADIKSGASGKQQTKERNEIYAAGAKARNAPLSGKGGLGRQTANRISQNVARNANTARFIIRGIRSTGGIPEKGPVRSVRSPTLARLYLRATGNKLYPRGKQIQADPNKPIPKSVPTPKGVNRDKLVAGMRK